MSKQVARWKLSDVVRAMSEASGSAYWRERPLLPETIAGYAKAHGVPWTLRWCNVTFPMLLGNVTTRAWDLLSDDAREALVVAAARRLKVPRRA